jgi:hypothetical protein
VKLRARTTAVQDRDVRAGYCDAVAVLGCRTEEPWFHLFRTDIQDLTLIRYAQSGDQHVARWPSRREFVLRELSATSVGPPEPVIDVFVRR